MKRELRDKWCSELRNPDNRQVEGQLHCDDAEMVINYDGHSGRVAYGEAVALEPQQDGWYGRCCLGVLQDEATKMGYDLDTPLKDGEFSFHDLEVLGLEEEAAVNLISCNDDKQLTFGEIAEEVEATVEVDDEPGV